MIDYGVALERILALAKPPTSERVPLLKAAGRILAESARAPWAMPRFDNSAMDGYAVRAGDLASASSTTPDFLAIAGESAAGHAYEHPLEPGETVRISTGARLPAGADAVVPFEAVRREDDWVVFTSPPAQRQNVRRHGSDVQHDAPLFPPGTPITPEVLSFLASFNLPTLNVYRPLRVGILTSGDEILAHGQSPIGSQIIGSSLYYLEQTLRDCACEPHLFGIAHDDPADFRKRFAEMLDWCDIAVTTAGVSVGEHDVVGRALEQLGATIHFWRVRVRPGKPMLLATINGTPHFGFPGNPVSTICNAEIFLKPFLRRCYGIEPAHAPTLRAHLAVDCPRDPDRLFFVYTRLVVEDGALFAHPYDNQNSANLLNPARSNALALAPPGPDPLEAGTEILVHPILRGLGVVG